MASYIGEMILTEIAVETLISARAVAAGGADRLELCADLEAGGLTPDDNLLEQVLAEVGIPVFPMVRPRPGDFVYAPSEIDTMCRTIETQRSMGAHGFVTGVLRPDNEIDEVATAELVAAAGGLPVTFHRAFDRARDQQRALEQLIELAVQRVLTSGGANSALEGADALRALVDQAGDRLIILAGGGVRMGNVADVVARTGVREVHSKLKERPDEEVSVRAVKEFVAKLHGRD